MKIVILAAGEGKRMLHLTKSKSKHLIKVLKRPFLSYLLDDIVKAGYKELILVTGYKAEKIEAYLKRCKYRNKVKIINQFEILGREKYGTAQAVMAIESIIKKEDFVVAMGDNLYSVKDLKEIGVKGKYNFIAGFSHQNPQKYGVLLLKNGFLKKIVEKPKRYIGNIVNTGLYKFTPEIFEKIKKLKISKRGEYELTDAINLLAKEKKVKVKVMKDYWLDFGNPADIIKLSRFLKNNKKNKK